MRNDHSFWGCWRKVEDQSSIEWLASSAFSRRFGNCSCQNLCISTFCSLSPFRFLLDQTFSLLLPLLLLSLQILYLFLGFAFGCSCRLPVLSPLQYSCLVFLTFGLVKIAKDSQNLISVFVGEDPLHRCLHIGNGLNAGLRGEGLEHRIRQERCKGEWPRCVLGANCLEPPVLQDEIGVLEMRSQAPRGWFGNDHLPLSICIS